MIGYFYVMKDKIIKMNATEENLRFVLDGKLPEDCVTVCQKEEIIDKLDEDASGIHTFLRVNGKRREYYSRDTSSHVGYYESFIWEDDKGLVYYESGWGDGWDGIQLAVSDF